MRNISSSKTTRGAILLLAIIASLFLMPCARHDEGPDLLEGLPPRLAKLLIDGDDSTLVLYARDAGLETFIDAKRHFEEIVQDMSRPEYLEHADSLYTLQKRICIVLDEEFDYEFCSKDLDFLESFSPTHRQRIMIDRADIWLTALDSSLPPDARIDSLTGYHGRMEDIRDTYGMSISKMALSEAYGAIGNKRIEKHYLAEASKGFAALGHHRLTCQSLGVLGTLYEREGKIDSMEFCYQTALDIAKRYRLSDQISRFSYFYARRYTRMGRLALANDLFNEAIELCKTNKGGCYEIRFIFHAMEFYADYSCWETVERMLSRAKILEKIYEDSRYSLPFAHGNKFIEARLQMARGNVTRANKLFQEADIPIKDVAYYVNPFTLYYYWASGLLDNDEAEKALEIIERGLNSAIQKSLLREEAKFLGLKASALFMTGDVEQSKRTIDRLDVVLSKLPHPFIREGITRDVLRAKIAIAGSDTTLALLHLENSLARLKTYLQLMDTSVQGYLWIDDCKKLHELMHELTAHDPELRYGAEQFWRDLALEMGKSQTDLNSSYVLATEVAAGSSKDKSTDNRIKFLDQFRVMAKNSMSKMRELGAIHLMYVSGNDHITRFIVTEDHVQSSRIPYAKETLQRLAVETHRHLAGIQQENGSSQSIDVLANLTELGNLLLPDDLSDHIRQGDTRTIYITTDDFLGLIPFETLNIGSDTQYMPLLDKFDVAYLHHFGPAREEPRSNAPGIIIVNSQCSKSISSRYPFEQKLKCVKAEGQAIAALDTTAILLQGPHATKQDIKKRWEESSYLYFATHIIRDPEIPYLVLIPLADPVGDYSPESDYLDFADIRSSRFDKCNLVVLSGCASGAPAVTAPYVGPSLGDAFLDAGADVVISTFWDVKDEDARQLMTLHARELNTKGRSHIKALCSARRKLLADMPDSFESFSWASYAVHTRGLPE
jgi:CHAT domain-containing protein/tetratricopeptide (TPR) repeat protein